MTTSHIPPQITATGLPIIMGLLLTLSLMAGMALAQEPPHREDGLAPPLQTETYWLILDSARPADELLPPLLKQLTQLGAADLVFDFNPVPQRSSPAAVPAIEVAIRPGAADKLRQLNLPGVLDLSQTLPPPPASPGQISIQGTTGLITGHVTAADNSTPVENAEVYVYDAVSFAFIGSTATDSSGFYTVTVTAPYSQTKLHFNGGRVYGAEWYDNQTSFYQATPLDLPQGGVITNINAALPGEKGYITGHITKEGGQPLQAGENIYISANNLDWGFHSTVLMGNGSDTAYTLPVRAGSYKVHFGLWLISYGLLEDEWYNNKSQYSQADPVIVAPKQTVTGINADLSLAPHGLITGHITKNGGQPLSPGEDISIYIKETGTGWSTSQNFSGDGSTTFYSIIGSPGTYKVEFGTWGQPHLQREWYNNRADSDAANSVTIFNGYTTPNINADLLVVPTGTITGHLTKNGGQPLDSNDDVDIEFYNINTNQWANSNGKTIFEADGSQTLYTVTLPSGTYKVAFWSGGGLQSEWYNNQTTFDTATTFVVGTGTTPNINADFTPSPPTVLTNCLTGTVQSGGIPVAEAQVRAYKSGETTTSYSASSNTSGHYALCNLSPGDYQISFSYFPSTTTWYNDQNSRAGADGVQLQANQIISNINGAPGELGGCISGQITNASSSWPQFKIYDAQGLSLPFWIGSYGTYLGNLGWTNDGSRFIACGLATGSYTLNCQESWYYDNGGTGSVTVTVTASHETSGVTCKIMRHIHLPLILKK